MDADKELVWMGSSLADLRDFPEDVKRAMGFALRVAQQGGKHVWPAPIWCTTGHVSPTAILSSVASGAGGRYPSELWGLNTL